MPKPSLFANKVFYKIQRKKISDSEKALISSILSKHNLEKDFLYSEIFIDDLFGTTYYMAREGLALLVRTSLNHGLWGDGDNLARMCGDTSCIFFEELGNGFINNIEYAIFQPFGPKRLNDSNPEERLVLSRFLGGAQYELSRQRAPESLPCLITAFDNYFDLCNIFKYIPLGAEREFNKSSPVSIEELNECISVIREDFIYTLNSLPDPPQTISAPCFGPLNINYVFYDPFLCFLPPMFPYVGDPFIDLAVNSNLLLLSPKEASKVFGVKYAECDKIEKHISYLSRELWHPAIVPQFINKLIDYSFSGFPNKSVVDSINLYNIFCRQRMLHTDKFEKIGKLVDTFFLNDIIY